MSQQVQLTLSVDEVNQILAALGQRPYADVFQLVHKIHSTVQTQLENPPQPDAPVTGNNSGSTNDT